MYSQLAVRTQETDEEGETESVLARDARYQVNSKLVPPKSFKTVFSPLEKSWNPWTWTLKYSRPFPQRCSTIYCWRRKKWNGILTHIQTCYQRLYATRDVCGLCVLYSKQIISPIINSRNWCDAVTSRGRSKAWEKLLIQISRPHTGSRRRCIERCRRTNWGHWKRC